MFQLKCYGAEDDKILGIPGEVKYCVFFLGLVLCYCEWKWKKKSVLAFLESNY